MYDHVERGAHFQASSRIEGHRSSIHTIKLIFWV
ncbi:hypothetical protein F383_36653 [Gossypium arboreum]|uniref:Uncharacterized protein n=1 Tax=Gossypium arboreum TaxID=29729 RepID=A0A0B0M664_GOSAR|nr:hypothetical protein F383_36653 [Gossypium arboreum]